MNEQTASQEKNKADVQFPFTRINTKGEIKGSCYNYKSKAYKLNFNKISTFS